jgi:hypothetical protein
MLNLSNCAFLNQAAQKISENVLVSIKSTLFFVQVPAKLPGNDHGREAL